MRTTAIVCPHCTKPAVDNQRRRWGAILGIAGVASLGLTMMACYGAPPCVQDNSCKTPDASADGSHPDGSAKP